MRNPFPLLTLVLFPVASLQAQDLGGGAPASHGRVPRLTLEKWIPGAATALTFSDLPTTTWATIFIFSPKSTSTPVPGFTGTLTADVFDPLGRFFFVPPKLPIPTLPASLNGTRIYIQGVVADNTGSFFTDGTGCDFFDPQVLVANSKGGNLSLLTHTSTTVLQTITQRNGRILHSQDRKFAYVLPETSRNIDIYSLTATRATKTATIFRSNGFIAGGTLTKDGKKMYVPASKGIVVIDLDPASTTYRKELTREFIATPVTNPGPGVLGSGPRAVVLTPDERRLFICYGQDGRVTPTFKGIVGVVDLTKTPAVHRSISITLGGNLLGIANEWHDIKISPDGRYVYAIEYGLDPNAGLGQFVKGFKNGAKLCIIDALVAGLEREIASVDTDGFEQEQIAIDKLGRNLWIPQVGHNGVPELLKVDVDRRSATRNTIVARIRLHATNYKPKNSAPGPNGVAVTPDGAIVYVGLSEDGTTAHPTPTVVRVDVATSKVVGTFTVGNTPHNISIQQRLN